MRWYRLNVTSDISEQDTDGDGVPDCEDNCPIRKTGEVNGDAVVSIDDAAPFVAILLNPDAAFPDDFCAADANEDGNVDGVDIQGITDVILNPSSGFLTAVRAVCPGGYFMR